VFGSPPTLKPVTRQLPRNYRTLPRKGRRTWAQRVAVGRTGRSSRWGHVHPGSVGKPHTGPRARAIAVHDRAHTEVVDLMGDVPAADGHLRIRPEACDGGKPDAGKLCAMSRTKRIAAAGGRSSGQGLRGDPTYLDLKRRGEKSMLGKRGAVEDV
jgi:hypothetical protein